MFKTSGSSQFGKSDPADIYSASKKTSGAQSNNFPAPLISKKDLFSLSSGTIQPLGGTKQSASSFPRPSSSSSSSPYGNSSKFSLRLGSAGPVHASNTPTSNNAFASPRQLFAIGNGDARSGATPAATASGPFSRTLPPSSSSSSNSSSSHSPVTIPISATSASATAPSHAHSHGLPRAASAGKRVRFSPDLVNYEKARSSPTNDPTGAPLPLVSVLKTSTTTSIWVPTPVTAAIPRQQQQPAASAASSSSSGSYQSSPSPSPTAATAATSGSGSGHTSVPRSSSGDSVQASLATSMDAVGIAFQHTQPPPNRPGAAIRVTTGSNFSPIVTHKKQGPTRPSLTEQLATIGAKASALTQEIRVKGGLDKGGDDGANSMPILTLPAKCFSVGTLNCRYPSPVRFMQDRMEYTFHHPYENTEVNMVMFYRDLIGATILGSKLKYKLPRALSHFPAEFDPANPQHLIVIELTSAGAAGTVRQKIMPLFRS